MSASLSITTADELLHAQNLGRCELIRGELIMMSPAGYPHGKIAVRIGRYLDQFVEEHHLGEVTGAETGFILGRNPDTVRAPDAAFISSGRLSAEAETGFFPGAPDLAVEVLSPGDRKNEVLAKVRQWLDAGCSVVWIVDPVKKTVTIAQRSAAMVHLIESDTLTGGDVLPGFELPLSNVFSATRGK